LVVAAQPKHWKNLHDYVSKFPIEFQVVIVKLCSEKSQEWFNEVSHSPEFREFRKKHPALSEVENDE